MVSLCAQNPTPPGFPILHCKSLCPPCRGHTSMIDMLHQGCDSSLCFFRKPMALILLLLHFGPLTPNSIYMIYYIDLKIIIIIYTKYIIRYIYIYDIYIIIYIIIYIFDHISVVMLFGPTLTERQHCFACAEAIGDRKPR